MEKKQNPAILLFESKKIDNDSIEYHKCSTTLKLHEFSQFIFCGKEYGIIYETDGELYQCKLKQIIRSADFRFNKITDNKIWKLHSAWEFVIFDNYFSSINPKWFFF